jgi:hypothetical protein
VCLGQGPQEPRVAPPPPSPSPSPPPSARLLAAPRDGPPAPPGSGTAPSRRLSLTRWCLPLELTVGRPAAAGAAPAAGHAHAQCRPQPGFEVGALGGSQLCPLVWCAVGCTVGCYANVATKWQRRRSPRKRYQHEALPSSSILQAALAAAAVSDVLRGALAAEGEEEEEEEEEEAGAAGRVPGRAPLLLLPPPPPPPPSRGHSPPPPPPPGAPALGRSAPPSTRQGVKRHDEAMRP